MNVTKDELRALAASAVATHKVTRVGAPKTVKRAHNKPVFKDEDKAVYLAHALRGSKRVGQVYTGGITYKDNRRGSILADCFAPAGIVTVIR